MLRTVQAKYTLSILLVATCFLSSLLLINYGLLRNYSLSTARDTAELMRQNVDRQMSQVFRDVEFLTRSIADYRVVKNADPEEMRELFISTVLVRQDYLRAIYLGTEEGEMHEWGVGEGFVDHTPDFPPDYDPRVRPWYRTASTADGYALTSPYVYASIDALGVTAVTTVKDDSGRRVGVLGIDIMLEGLRNVVEAMDIRKKGKVVLLTQDGEVLVSQFYPFPNHPRKLLPFEYPALLDRRDATGVEKLYGSRYLVTKGQNAATGWWIILAVPYESIMAFSLQNLRFIVFSDIVLALLLSVLIAMITRRILTAPLETIMNTMRRMERGELEARIPDSGGDEFATIGRLFNRLADAQIASSRKMEEKVKARTQRVLSLQQENLRLRIIEEKESIYGNLHDSLGARLTGINISNNVAKNTLLRDDKKTTGEMLIRIERNTHRAIQDLKEILFTESEAGRREPGVNSSRGLIHCIENTIRNRLALKEIRLESDLPPAEEWAEVSRSVLFDLEKMIQEVISNVIKHSRADVVRLSVTLNSRGLQLLVKDDGIGFNLRDEYGNSFGLQGLYNRAERMGGLFKIITRPGRGTQVNLQVRLEEEE